MVTSASMQCPVVFFGLRVGILVLIFLRLLPFFFFWPPVGGGVQGEGQVMQSAAEATSCLHAMSRWIVDTLG